MDTFESDMESWLKVRDKPEYSLIAESRWKRVKARYGGQRKFEKWLADHAEGSR